MRMDVPVTGGGEAMVTEPLCWVTLTWYPVAPLLAFQVAVRLVYPGVTFSPVTGAAYVDTRLLPFTDVMVAVWSGVVWTPIHAHTSGSVVPKAFCTFSMVIWPVSAPPRLLAPGWPAKVVKSAWSLVLLTGPRDAALSPAMPV